jgi:hypothetical protein
MPPLLLAPLLLLVALSAAPRAAAVVACGGNATCPDGNTCCAKSGGGFACCADEEPGQGVCCSDGQHCCANGYFCRLGDGLCTADDPAAHPLAQATNLYSLCPAVIPAAPFELAGLVPGGSGLRLPYYASPGPIGVPDAQVQIAVIVVHGSARNADDYFCSMLEAARLQQAWPVGNVLVVAPRFTEPRDSPPSRWLTWNGTGLGDWRKGGNSTLADAPGGQPRPSLSSFAAIDGFVSLLSDKRLFPQLKQLVITGHSAGGQTIQRYALASGHRPTQTQLLDGTGTGATVPTRFVVANPSSFCYLNASRWTDASATTLALPAPGKCPTYNQ